MASLGIASSLTASPVLAKAAVDAPVRPDNTVDDAVQSVLPNVLFAALFGELAAAPDEDAAGDASPGEGAGRLSDAAARIFAVDIANPLPQPWRPPMPDGERGFELSSTGFAPVIAGEAAAGTRAARQFATTEHAPQAPPQPPVTAAGGEPWTSPRVRLEPDATAAGEQDMSPVPEASDEEDIPLPAAQVMREADLPVAAKAAPPRVEPARAAKSKAATVAEPSNFPGDVPANPLAAVSQPVTVSLPKPAVEEEEVQPEVGSASSGTHAALPIPATRAPESSDAVPRPAGPGKRRAPQPSETAAMPIIWPLAAKDDPMAGKPPTRAVEPETSSLPERSVVRTVAAGVREKGELAFTARLAPVTAESPSSRAARVREPFVSATPKPAPPKNENSAPVETSPVSARPAPHRDAARDSEEQHAPPDDRQPATALPARAAVHVPGASREGASASGREEGVHTPQAVLRAALDAEPPPMRPASPAREIRLELLQGEERVELKLTDKAGEVKVAVRTADTHLAERLRADLPALSSRLEQGGLRAETWQPSQAGAGDWRRTDEAAAANNGGPQEDGSRQQGREQQGEGEPRRPRVRHEDEQPKEKRKDFEWFLSGTQ